MRNIQEYIFEAWTNHKSEQAYLKELEEMLDKVDKRAEKRKKLMSGNNRSWSMGYSINPTKVLQKYPMAILIDKAGYTPEKLNTYSYKRKKDGSYEKVNKTVTDLDSYGRWLYNTIKDGKISKEDLVSWWKEYEDEIAKSHWFDPSYVMKHVDPTRIWDIYFPNSEGVFERIVEEPSTIFNYTLPDLRIWRLAKDEREQVTAYYSDPVNKEALSKEFSKLKKMMSKHKPTLKASAEKWVALVLRDSKINGESYDFDDYFAEKHKPKRYYSGSNDEDCYGDAYYSLIMGAIKDMYKFDFYGGLEYLGDGQYGENAKYSVRGHSGDDNDDAFKKFADDAQSLEFEITDLGTSEKSGDTSGVSSSSFSTFYRHDFKIVGKIKKEEVYNKTVKNVVVYSSFYSGGWD